MNDRIRSKPPINNPESWSNGVINSIKDTSSGKEVEVNSDDRQVVLSVTDSIYDLFTSRLESETVEGETIWYKKKS